MTGVGIFGGSCSCDQEHVCSALNRMSISELHQVCQSKICSLAQRSAMPILLCHLNYLKYYLLYLTIVFHGNFCFPIPKLPEFVQKETSFYDIIRACFYNATFNGLFNSNISTKHQKFQQFVPPLSTPDFTAAITSLT